MIDDALPINVPPAISIISWLIIEKDPSETLLLITVLPVPWILNSKLSNSFKPALPISVSVPELSASDNKFLALIVSFALSMIVTPLSWAIDVFDTTAPLIVVLPVPWICCVKSPAVKNTSPLFLSTEPNKWDASEVKDLSTRTSIFCFISALAVIEPLIYVIPVPSILFDNILFAPVK